MRIFPDFEGVQEIPNAVLTIGTFDGVHSGHQKIIERLNEEAKEINGESVLFTFYPHPRMVLYPESHGLKLIQTQAEKLQKLKECGLQNVIVYPFTMEFSRLTALEFVRDFLVNQLHVKKLVIGYDHQFGKNREGSIEFLRNVCDTYGFEVIEIEAQEIDEVNISSTKIRNAVLDGNIELANEFLGSPFEIHGEVIKGSQLGRELGFPTANIAVNNELKLLPKNGVYAVEVLLQNESKSYHGMLNIGVKPTIGMIHDDLSIEVHIFDLKKDLYGQFITLKLLQHIRDERKFEGIEELKSQLERDEKTIRSIITTSI